MDAFLLQHLLRKSGSKRPRRAIYFCATRTEQARVLIAESNKMTLKLLWEIKAFCLVAEKRSFVQVARILGRSPSAITRVIQTLEESLGVELILRTSKQVNLTSAGACYYEHAKKILEVQTHAEADLQNSANSPQGWIRFSAPEILAHEFLPKVVAKFSVDYPNVQTDVIFRDESLDPVREKLDFSIRGAFPQSSDLIGYPLWSYKRHLYASPKYVEQRGAPHDPFELANHELIMHTAPRILKDWYFVGKNEPIRIKAVPRHRFSSGVAILQAAIAGAGIARLADWIAAPAVKRGQLVKICPAYRIASSSGMNPCMHAVHGFSYMPKHIRLFLDEIRVQAHHAFVSDEINEGLIRS
jgi:DNA-binding transcriptional LysR family regulator